MWVIYCSSRRDQASQTEATFGLFLFGLVDIVHIKEILNQEVSEMDTNFHS